MSQALSSALQIAGTNCPVHIAPTLRIRCQASSHCSLYTAYSATCPQMLVEVSLGVVCDDIPLSSPDNRIRRWMRYGGLPMCQSIPRRRTCCSQITLRTWQNHEPAVRTTSLRPLAAALQRKCARSFCPHLRTCRITRGSFHAATGATCEYFTATGSTDPSQPRSGCGTSCRGDCGAMDFGC